MRTIAALSTMIALIASLSGPGTAAAEGEPPCLRDIKRLCGSVPPTGNFVQGCLEAHDGDLSAGCRKHVGTFTRDSAALTAACQRDLSKHCANELTAAGASESCLVQHRDALSTTCADALNEHSRE